MAWERGYKFTNFTAVARKWPGNEATSSKVGELVASFPGHFLAPPTLPGIEEHDPAFVSVQLGMFASYVATR